jgi:peptide/nickel transport system permease protein
VAAGARRVIAYLVRRLAFGALTVVGVLLFLFWLFFVYAEPEDVAKRALGEKAPPEAVAQWLANHGYDKPAVWNPEAPLDTRLAEHLRRMLFFDFGASDADDAPIAARLREGIVPTLSLTVPLFALGLPLGLALALLVAFFRDTPLDRAAIGLCVLAMSVSVLIYILAGQYLLGKLLRWFPISGFDPDPAVLVRFLALPLVVGLVSGLGSDVRFFRTVFLEEASRDYVRTARAKGASDARVMLRHVLPNALIPVLTNVSFSVPWLFTGSLLLESFFGIPGLGAITVEAIQANDFSTLRVMVYLGALLFIGVQIATDLAYTFVDPRVRLR